MTISHIPAGSVRPRLNKKIHVCALLVLLLGVLNAKGKMGYYENTPFSDMPTNLQAAITSEEQPNWDKGFLDVTRAPYNAAGNGVHDDTTNLQAAIDDAYLCNFVVWFPSGTYKISSTLQMRQDIPGRKFNHKLVGSTTGTRPVIRLADGTTNLVNRVALLYWFDNTTNSTYNLGTNNVGTTDASRMYLAELRGVDVDMGYNPGARAVSMDGAQLCAIEDARIYGDQFETGIYRIPGSGGNVINVEIYGGKYGIYQDAYRPEPSLVGVILSNQTDCAVRITESRGPVCLTGCKIISPDEPSPTYRAILTDHPNSSESCAHGSLTLVDTSIEVKGTNSVAIEDKGATAYMKNVYFKADVLVKAGNKWPDTSWKYVYGDGSQWKCIDSYVYADAASGASVRIDGTELGPYFYGRGITTSDYDTVVSGTLIVASPPADLVSRHIWNAGTFPSWEDANVINITNFGAHADTDVGDESPVPDDDYDNSTAIQNAIDAAVASNKVVFIPRGHFYIKSHITLKSGLKIIGAGNNISCIEVHPTQWGESTNTQSYAIDTENSASGSLTMQELCLIGEEVTPNGTNPSGINTMDHLKTTLLRIQTGNTLFRDVQVEKVAHYVPQTLDVPFIVLENNAGGHIYNLCMDIGPKDGSTYSTNFHQLFIHNTHTPLLFYQPDPEYIYTTNGQVRIDSCQNVHFLAFKYEDATMLLEIHDSQNVDVLGGSGNYELLESSSPAIFYLSGSSTNIELANLQRKIATNYTGYSPTYKEVLDGTNATVQACQTILYRKGTTSLSATSSAVSNSLEFVNPPTLVSGGETVPVTVHISAAQPSIARVQFLNGTSNITFVTITTVPAGTSTQTFNLSIPAGLTVSSNYNWKCILWNQSWQQITNRTVYGVLYGENSMSFLSTPSVLEAGQSVTVTVAYCALQESIIRVLLKDGSTTVAYNTIQSIPPGSGTLDFPIQLPDPLPASTNYTWSCVMWDSQWNRIL